VGDGCVSEQKRGRWHACDVPAPYEPSCDGPSMCAVFVLLSPHFTRGGSNPAVPARQSYIGESSELMEVCRGVLHKPPRCHVPVIKHSSSRDAWACMHGSREASVKRHSGVGPAFDFHSSLTPTVSRG
jgi:hypothetical protein